MPKLSNDNNDNDNNDYDDSDNIDDKWYYDIHDNIDGNDDNDDINDTFDNYDTNDIFDNYDTNDINDNIDDNWYYDMKYWHRLQSLLAKFGMLELDLNLPWLQMNSMWHYLCWKKESLLLLFVLLLLFLFCWVVVALNLSKIHWSASGLAMLNPCSTRCGTSFFIVNFFNYVHKKLKIRNKNKK